MFVAQDEFGTRIYADDASPSVHAFCPECGEPLVHKAGRINRPYFSHKAGTPCGWGNNKDSKSKWHLRMQGFFPKENNEYRFLDEKTGEIHIADVFIPEKNTVIEFQKSPISEEEFMSRTAFHLNSGRRIAWIFDESKEKCAENEYGRLKKDELFGTGWPYEGLSFQWMRRPRKCLEYGPDLSSFADRYSIFVYSGCEGDDVIRRIVMQDIGFEFVTLSFHPVKLDENFDVEELFLGDKYWINQYPWNIEAENRRNATSYPQGYIASPRKHFPRRRKNLRL